MRGPNHEAVLNEAEAPHEVVNGFRWGKVDDEIGVVNAKVRRNAVRNSQNLRGFLILRLPPVPNGGNVFVNRLILVGCLKATKEFGPVPIPNLDSSDVGK